MATSSAPPPSPSEASKPPDTSEPIKPAPLSRRTRRRQRMAKALALLVSVTFSAVMLEGVFRVIERGEISKEYHHGEGGNPLPDARWGWKMSPGPFEQSTAEFTVTGDVNAMFMNDDAVDPIGDKQKTRVLALGDSHTFAVGVSKDETWAKVLQRDLIARTGKPFRVYNDGCSGYNLHQYLLRLIDHGPTLRPDYVVVGFSYATDLFDLLPPEHGGWTYGATTQPRDYFDFDASGALEERHWVPPAEGATGQAKTISRAMAIRNFATGFATLRYLHRSKLALFVGSHVTVGGQSLWPNMDVVVEKDVGPGREYTWRLAKALLLKMKAESEKLGAQLVIAGIPYLPQVYDEIWSSTFGGNEKYSKTAAIERIRAFCEANGIRYVDTLDALHDRAQKVGHWLHHRRDAHPTREGQEVIAEVIAASGALPPIADR